MKRWLLLGALLASAGAGAAETTTVTPLLSRDLSGIPGQEGALVRVDYAPGASSPVHRHNAHVFVYVLKGSVVMQATGAVPVTLQPGQTFYEGPNDIHLVSRNASATEPAAFLAFFVKNKGAPFVMPAE
ncbi:MAG: cupin domain-containing protein [Acetobacteraceae bacterium]|nr:cupin domain-containing protein [Acetobacteraceae bacterium]